MPAADVKPFNEQLVYCPVVHVAGAFEAGAFPAMWAHLTRFYAGGPDLADAWGCIAAAQPVAQVMQSSPTPCATMMVKLVIFSV